MMRGRRELDVGQVVGAEAVMNFERVIGSDVVRRRGEG
jgi:hypothetical protein